MKKIMILMTIFFCIGCSSKYEYIERSEFPQAIMGTLPNGLSITAAEDIIATVCINSKWNITDRAEGWMKIYKAVDFYDLHGSITYNENNYTISEDNITSPERVEYDQNRISRDRVVFEKKRSKLFNTYASKLARSIQKQGLKLSRTRSDVYQRREPVNSSPIIINNNIVK